MLMVTTSMKKVPDREKKLLHIIIARKGYALKAFCENISKNLECKMKRLFTSANTLAFLISTEVWKVI
jgi:hypothetical protein